MAAKTSAFTQRNAGLPERGRFSNGRLAVAGVLGIALVALGGIGVTSLLSEDQPPAIFPRVAAQQPPRSMGGESPPAPTVPAASAWKLTGGVSKVSAVTRREWAVAGRGELVTGFTGLSELVRSCGAQGASFLLQLEAIGGTVRVESARLEEQGTAPKAAVACAESALSGQAFPAPNVPAGRRWEIPFSAGSP